jgi:integrase
MRVNLKLRELPSGRKSFYLELRDGKKRKFESLGLFIVGNGLLDKETRKRAQVIRDMRFKELHSQTWGHDPAEARGINFSEYARAIMAEHRNPNTALQWRTSIQHWESYAGTDVTLGSINPDMMRGFKTFLENKVSAHSASSYYMKIKACLNRAVMEDKIAKNPALGVKFARIVRPEPVHLDLDEIRLLRQGYIQNSSVQRAFLFSCFTGLRFGDITALTQDEISGDSLKIRQRKTQEPLTIHLSAEARKILGEQLKQAKGDRVFPLPSETTTNNALRVLAKRAGVKKHIHFHVGRHTFACMALNRGVDLYTVSKLLGHKSISTTQIYAQVVDQKKREAVNLLPKL